MLEDGINTLAYGHNDITSKVERILEGQEICLMSIEEAKSKGLHPSHAIDPNLIQQRVTKASMWMSHRQTGIAKSKKRILDGLNVLTDEASDMQDCTQLKHKTPSSIIASVHHLISKPDSPAILPPNADNLSPFNESLDHTVLSDDD